MKPRYAISSRVVFCSILLLSLIPCSLFAQTAALDILPVNRSEADLIQIYNGQFGSEELNTFYAQPGEAEDDPEWKTGSVTVANLNNTDDDTYVQDGGIPLVDTYPLTDFLGKELLDLTSFHGTTAGVKEEDGGNLGSVPEVEIENGISPNEYKGRDEVDLIKLEILVPQDFDSTTHQFWFYYRGSAAFFKDSRKTKAADCFGTFSSGGGGSDGMGGGGSSGGGSGGSGGSGSGSGGSGGSGLEYNKAPLLNPIPGSTVVVWVGLTGTSTTIRDYEFGASVDPIPSSMPSTAGSTYDRARATGVFSDFKKIETGKASGKILSVVDTTVGGNTVSEVQFKPGFDPEVGTHLLIFNELDKVPNNQTNWNRPELATVTHRSGPGIVTVDVQLPIGLPVDTLVLEGPDKIIDKSKMKNLDFCRLWVDAPFWQGRLGTHNAWDDVFQAGTGIEFCWRIVPKEVADITMPDGKPLVDFDIVGKIKQNDWFRDPGPSAPSSVWTPLNTRLWMPPGDEWFNDDHAETILCDGMIFAVDSPGTFNYHPRFSTAANETYHAPGSFTAGDILHHESEHSCFVRMKIGGAFPPRQATNSRWKRPSGSRCSYFIDWQSIRNCETIQRPSGMRYFKQFGKVYIEEWYYMNGIIADGAPNMGWVE